MPHIWALHRNPKYWENPDNYMPERFIDHQIVPYSYIPFSSGPRYVKTYFYTTSMKLNHDLIHASSVEIHFSFRTCIGNKFALVEGTIALAELVRRFTFALNEADKGKPIKVKRIGVLIPATPIRVIVKRR